jgi:glycosyltransferase involved in cell wall biosynthesis
MQNKLLIIGSVWPEPGSSAAGSRMLQLISFFRKQGYSITFASHAGESEFAVEPAKHRFDKVNILLNDESFDEFISGLKPQIVMFDRFMTEEQYGWRVAENCPDAMRILDTEDLHCLRAGRQSAWKAKKEFTNDDLVNDTAKREIASIYRCDLSLIISQFEMELLTGFFKVQESSLFYLPFMLDQVDTSLWPAFTERKNFVTIGNFHHEPNMNSVLYLKEEIWPLIRKKLPDAEMHVYGAYPTQKVTGLHSKKDKFLVKGRAEDASLVIMTAKVLLAPLRFGAGLKGKLIEAMQCGTPNVTTDIGAEGMFAGTEWSGSIKNDPQEFADAAVELYTNERVWKEAQFNGIRIINECFQKNAFQKIFAERILALTLELKIHRQNNFTGAMLMHHTMMGAKYMSKWIEEKNKQAQK